MTPILLSFLLLFTIMVAFVFGISMGYWVVCGILHFFKPARTHDKPGRTPAFAHSPSSN